MAEWLVDTLDRDGNVLHTMRPENLEFTLEIRDEHTISYEVDLAHPVLLDYPDEGLDFIGPYRTDFALRRQKDSNPIQYQTIMAGLHTGHTVAPDAESGEQKCIISGRDWKHYLNRRKMPFDPNNVLDWEVFWFNEYAATIIADFIELAYLADSSPAQHVVFTYGSFTEGPQQNYQIVANDSNTIFEHIQALAEMEPGFDWDVDPISKEILINDPETADPDTPILVFIQDAEGSDAVQSISFTNTGPGYTHVIAYGPGFGAGAHRSVKNWAAPNAMTTFRRLDETLDFANVKNVNQLKNLTKAALNINRQPRHEVELTVYADQIDEFWENVTPGQYIEIQSWNLYSHIIDAVFKVLRMSGRVDTEGNELCTLSLEQYYDPGTPLGENDV